eukprot:238515-Prymnesium_polylepis.1
MCSLSGEWPARPPPPPRKQHAKHRSRKGDRRLRRPRSRCPAGCASGTRAVVEARVGADGHRALARAEAEEGARVLRPLRHPHRVDPRAAHLALRPGVAVRDAARVAARRDRVEARDGPRRRERRRARGQAHPRARVEQVARRPRLARVEVGWRQHAAALLGECAPVDDRVVVGRLGDLRRGQQLAEGHGQQPALEAVKSSWWFGGGAAGSTRQRVVAAAKDF